MRLLILLVIMVAVKTVEFGTFFKHEGVHYMKSKNQGESHRAYNTKTDKVETMDSELQVDVDLVINK